MPRNAGFKGPQKLANSSSSVGIWGLNEQQKAKGSGNWVSTAAPAPAGRIFTTSPAIGPSPSWNLDVDGAIAVTSGTYTLTATSNFCANIYLWGQGGQSGSNNGSPGYTGGGGGALQGLMSFTSGQSYFLNLNAGRGTSTPGSYGGGYAGIFVGTSASFPTVAAIAGGGGGAGYDDGGRNQKGGVGGYPSGGTSCGYPTTPAGGGTQSAGGSGGGSPIPGNSGSALQGGPGGGPGSGYWGGGGGGGYYGGGGGGIQSSWAGSGGGGGSNYTNPSYVSSVTHSSGVGTTAGNNASPFRGPAGTGATGVGQSGGPSKIYIN